MLGLESKHKHFHSPFVQPFLDLTNETTNAGNSYECLLGIFQDSGSFPDSLHYPRWRPCENSPPWGRDVRSKSLPWGHTSQSNSRRLPDPYLPPPPLGLDTDRCIKLYFFLFNLFLSILYACPYFL